MKSEEIEQYLTELGAALKRQGIKKPVRILLPAVMFFAATASSK